MDVPPEFQDTLAVFKEVIAAFDETIRRNSLLVQACRVVNGSRVSQVRHNTYDHKTTQALNLKMERYIDKGRADFGCAMGIVPDGEDVYVVVIGAMSERALTLLAETIANRAAARFTGASLA